MTDPLEPPIPRSEWASANTKAADGSARLAWAAANVIDNYARRHRLTIPNAMNVLLYNGELT